MFPWIAGAVVVLGVLLVSRRRADAAGLSGGSSVGGSARNAEPSAEVYAAIKGVAEAYGIPAAFALANAAHESRFIPTVGLNTLAGGAPAGAIPERSIGLHGVNVNPNTRTGQARIAAIKQLGGLSTDAQVLDWLRDPIQNTAFWADRIVRSLADRAEREGRTGREKWIAVRVWLAASTLDPDRGEGLRRRNLFTPTFEKWIAREGL